MIVPRYPVLMRGERGQLLLFVAVLIPVLLGFTALAIDLGIGMAAARDAQNAADAIVLAAAQEIRRDSSDTSGAESAARVWAERNDVDPDTELTCCTFEDRRPAGSPDGQIETITVLVEEKRPTVFAKIFGVDEVRVERRAVAQVVHADTGPVCPWAMVATDTSPGYGTDTHYGLREDTVYALKVQTTLQTGGNFGPLRLGGNGADVYLDLIAAGCTPDASGFNVWTEGSTVFTSPQEGNVGQPTRSTLDDLYSYEREPEFGGHVRCDVPFTLDLSDPTIGYPTVDYQPYLDDPDCGGNPVPGRVVLIPIIDHLPNGNNEPVAVLGLASAYIVYWDRTGSPANMQVYGLFLPNAVVDSRYITGRSDNPFAPLRVVLLE